MKVYVHTANDDIASYFPDQRQILGHGGNPPRKIRGARSMNQIRAERRKAVKQRQIEGQDPLEYGVFAVEVTEGES